MLFSSPAFAITLAASLRCPSPVLRSAHPPGARGSHVLLDFVGFCAPAAESGEWMLQSLRDAVAAHGVREVHSKLVVLGERGESPPGFTAAILIDESHVTAHCYSDDGLLAIDVFTCGAHDPRPLAADIRQRVEARVPGAQCVLEECVGRFRDGSYMDARSLKAKPAVRLHVHKRAERSSGGRMLSSEDSKDGKDDSEGDGDDECADGDDECDAAMMASFARRVEEEGGAKNILLQSEAERATDAAQSASRRAGTAVTKALDLEPRKVKGGRGVMVDQGWLLTLSFFFGTIALAAWAAFTTDFGGVDAGLLDAEYEAQFSPPPL